LAESFTLLPIGPQGISAAGAEAVVAWSAGLIGQGLLLGLPVVVALLAINFALGVMGRAAPQLNLFAVGFPVMILIGVVLILVTLDGYAAFTDRLFEQAFLTTRTALEAR
jgi:flagellar biosynthesis protein FliR